jgi:hypothetical protein
MSVGDASSSHIPTRSKQRDQDTADDRACAAPEHSIKPRVQAGFSTACLLVVCPTFVEPATPPGLKGEH